MTVKKVRSMCIVCSEVFECEAQENQKALPVLLNNMWTIFMRYFYVTPAKWKDILKFYNEVFEIPFCLRCRNDIAELLIFHNKLQTLLEKIGRLRANISATIVNTVANKKDSIQNEDVKHNNNNNNNTSQIDNSPNLVQSISDSQKEDSKQNTNCSTHCDNNNKCESTESVQPQVEIRLNNDDDDDDDIIEIKHEKKEKIEPELVIIIDDDEGKEEEEEADNNKSQIKSQTPSAPNEEMEKLKESNIIYNKSVHDQIKNLRKYIAQRYLPKIQVVDLKDEPDNIRSRNLDYDGLILIDDDGPESCSSGGKNGGGLRLNSDRKKIKRKGWNYGLKWISVGVERFNGQTQRTWLYGDGKWPVIEVQGVENGVENGFRCGTCDQMRQRKVDMARHILDCHSGPRTKKLGSHQAFKCNFGGCSISFVSRASLQLHQMRNHRQHEKRKRGRPFKYSSSQFNSVHSSVAVANCVQYANTLRTEANNAKIEEEEEEMERDEIFNPVVHLKTEVDLWTDSAAAPDSVAPWNDFNVVNPCISFDAADAVGQVDNLSLGTEVAVELADPMDEAEGIFHYSQWSYAQLEDEDALRCLKCGGSEPSHEQMILHIQNTHEKKLRQYGNSMLTEEDKYLVDDTENEDGEDEDDVVDKFVCEYPNCRKSYKTEGGLIYHAKLHSGFLVKCPVCEFCCTRDDSMRRHLFRHSDYVYNGGPFQLVRGNAVTRQQYTSKSSGQGKRYQCPMCPKSYRHQTNLSSHKKIHRGNLDMRKMVRTVENNMKRVKRKGLNRSGPKRKFICDICRASYTTLAGLQLHQKFHTGDVIKCPEPNCTRVFSQKTNCEYHMRSFHGKHFRFPRVRELQALNRKHQELDQLVQNVGGEQEEPIFSTVQTQELEEEEEEEKEEPEPVIEDDVIVLS